VVDILASATGGLSVIMQGIDMLGDLGVNFVPKSITSMIALQFEDEHFAVEETVGDNQITWLDLDIEYLDMLLSGGLNSFTHFLDYFYEDGHPANIFPVDAQASLSFKANVSGGLDFNDDNAIDQAMKTIQSGYLNASVSGLRIDDSGMPTAGTLNASLNYSAVMDYCMIIGSSGASMYNTPVQITIAMKPIIGASLSGFSSYNPSSADEAWGMIRDALWGSSATDCITITASYKNSYGQIVQMDALKDEAVVACINSMMNTNN
jgi:hypothetical protein